MIRTFKIVLICAAFTCVLSSLSFAAPPPLTITNPTCVVSPCVLTSQTAVSLSFTFTATGGLAPYTWSILSGDFAPCGVSLSSGGLLSGTTAQGVCVATVEVTDSAGPMFDTAQVDVVLQVGPQGVIVNGSVTMRGTVGIPTTGAVVSLVSITVSPSNPLKTVGSSIEFTAQGTYSDGSTADVTALLGWSSSDTSVATTSVSSDYGANNVYNCIAGGAVTAKGELGAINGSTTLTCTSYQITPSGVLTTYQSALFSQQFTESGGTGPYTWSATSLPSFLTMTSGGLLSGTPSSTGTYNFTVQNTDSSLPPFTDSTPITLNVIVQPNEDNIYCNPSGLTSYPGGVTTDGPAQLPVYCFYTAISATPNLNTSQITVCPSGQTSGGNPVSCTVNTFADALTAIYQQSNPCDTRIVLYPTIDDTPNGTKNIFVFDGHTNFAWGQGLPPITCGPNHVANTDWIWVTTSQLAKLPPAGSRMTPSWAGVASLPGRPVYAQTTDIGVSTGRYIPQILGVQSGPNSTCIMIEAGPGTSGWRFIGVELVCPMGRHASVTNTDGNVVQVCASDPAGNPNCAPGSNDSMAAIGCDPGTFSCTPSLTSGGANYILLDRVLMHGCDDYTDTLCGDALLQGISITGGNHLGIIDSYIYDIHCMSGIGPCVESHGTGGENDLTGADDYAIKIVNNYLESSSINSFFGGANSTPGILSRDGEYRRNHLFRPLSWKPNDPSFTGLLQNTWINKTGNSYDPSAPTCYVTTSTTGQTPACTVTIASNKVAELYTCQTGPCVSQVAYGSGYTQQHAKIKICRYDNSGKCLVTPDPTITLVTSGGSIPSGKTVYVVTDYYHTSNGFESDPSTLPSGSGGVSVTTAGCTGGGCSILVTAPPSVAGFTYNIYSCSTDSSACTGGGNVLQNAANQSGNYTITAVGAGSALPNPAGALAVDGIFNVKNDWEFKNGSRWLMEGNISENCWIGNSDQLCTAHLYNPRNANNGCPTCTVDNITDRYNYTRNSVFGFDIAVNPATRCNGSIYCIALAIHNISIHDDVYDGLNGKQWISTPGAFTQQSGGCAKIFNVNPNLQAINNIKINHLTCVPTMPSGAGAVGTYFMELITSPKQATQAGGASISFTPNAGSIANGTVIGAVLTMNYSTTPPVVTLGGQSQFSNEVVGTASGCGTGCSVSITGGQTQVTQPFSGFTVYLRANGLAYSETAQPGCINIAVDPCIRTTINTAGSILPADIVLLPYFTLENSLGSGGVKQAAGISGGGFPCSSQACSAGFPYSGPTEVALRSGLANSVQLPISGGLYTSGNVLSVQFVGAGCSAAPSTVTLPPPEYGGGRQALIAYSTAQKTLYVTDFGSGYQKPVEPVTFTGGSCGPAYAYVAGYGFPSDSGWCYDHNLSVLSPWAGTGQQPIPMNPYPTAQGDPSNSCDSHAGGGNVSANAWSDVKFVNFTVDASGQECGGYNCATGDLHMLPASPGYHAANDGTDIGANIDLVMGCNGINGSCAAGTPSPYTGISINNGVAIFPQ